MMSLEREKKQAIIEKFRLHESDTASPEVQIAVLTQRINDLTRHLPTHEKDQHSRRGLYQMIGQRRGLLNYLQATDIDRYRKLIDELGLRR